MTRAEGLDYIPAQGRSLESVENLLKNTCVVLWSPALGIYPTDLGQYLLYPPPEQGLLLGEASGSASQCCPEPTDEEEPLWVIPLLSGVAKVDFLNSLLISNPSPTNRPISCWDSSVRLRKCSRSAFRET